MIIAQITRNTTFTMFSIVVYICLLHTITNLSLASGMKCGVLLESAEKWGKVHEECSKSNKVDESKVANLSINTTVEEFDIDDNCFIQCMYKGNNVLNSDGLINKKETQNIFKGNMTTEMHKKVTSIWEACVDDAAKISNTKGFNRCKLLAVHDFCFNKRMYEAGVQEMNC